MSARRNLHALGARLGIVPTYWDIMGREHPTSDATCEALARAMGRDASDEAAAARALEEIEAEEAARLVEPVQVWREYAQGAPVLRVRRSAEDQAVAFALELQEEGGAIHRSEGTLSPRSGVRWIDLELPACPEPGYHVLRLTLDLRSGPRSVEQRLVVAPRTAVTVQDVLDEERGFGLWTNLYSVRSARSPGGSGRPGNWGFGDLSDLRDLGVRCGRLGGDFVGVNPLHTVRGRGAAIAPYSPTSRLFRSVLYLDVEAVPELEGCDAARALLASAPFQERLARLRAADAIDYEAVLDAKLPVLRLLHDAFAERHRGRGTERGEAYARFLAREGEPLTLFALHATLEARFAAEGKRCDWRDWPAAYQDPRSPTVAALLDTQAEEVDFHRFVQFELDLQLAAAAEAGLAAGLRIGLYHDLAVGSAPDAADTWIFQGLFAPGVFVGAPPDDYSPTGQDWGLPPLDPHRLRADGYRFFSRLLRASFAHAGALRIDHVMGLMRLFWIPAGRPGTEGAYVRYPVEDLLGILALESRRHGALVVGEDLGTVPAELPGLLSSFGILSSSVLYFERDGEAFRPPGRYSPRSLVTANTHDLVPLPGFVAGRDLELRRAAGSLASDADLARARAVRSREVEALLARLREEGLLAEPGVPAPAALVAAVNAFLARTPSALAGVSLDDLLGETDPVNLPGVPTEAHRSWSRRMRRPLDALDSDPEVAAALAPLRARRGGTAPLRDR